MVQKLSLHQGNNSFQLIDLNIRNPRTFWNATDFSQVWRQFEAGRVSPIKCK